MQEECLATKHAKANRGALLGAVHSDWPAAVPVPRHAGRGTACIRREDISWRAQSPQSVPQATLVSMPNRELLHRAPHAPATGSPALSASSMAPSTADTSSAAYDSGWTGWANAGAAVLAGGNGGTARVSSRGFCDLRGAQHTTVPPSCNSLLHFIGNAISTCTVHAHWGTAQVILRDPCVFSHLVGSSASIALHRICIIGPTLHGRDSVGSQPTSARPAGVLPPSLAPTAGGRRGRTAAPCRGPRRRGTRPALAASAAGVVSLWSVTRARWEA